MERTNEFQSLLKRKYSFKRNSDLETINKINDLIKTKGVKELISIDRKLNEMKIHNSFEYKSNQESDIFINALTNLRILKISNIQLNIKLKLKSIKENQVALETEEINESSINNQFIERNIDNRNITNINIDNKNIVKRRDFSLINSQINEISHIMDDLTTHINLQGIKIAKIEELREISKTRISQTYFEIERKWKSISNRRKILIIYFILWIIILLIFAIIKKYK